MMENQPATCHPDAYRLFAEQLPVIETTNGLMNAAVAIALHRLPETDPAVVDRQFDSLAGRVWDSVRSRQPQAVLAHLHRVLFEEEGYRGNTSDYYNPANSYLPTVLETRRGIPIALALVYKITAERAGLVAEGINTPGHFLVRVMTAEGWMIVDPFMGGGVLTEEEAFARVEQVTNRQVPRSRKYLASASHAQWLSRMLVNLQHIFLSTERRADVAAMSELQSLLDDALY